MLVIATLTACDKGDQNPETDPSASDATTVAVEDATTAPADGVTTEAPKPNETTAAPDGEVTAAPTEENGEAASETPSEELSEATSDATTEDPSEGSAEEATTAPVQDETVNPGDETTEETTEEGYQGITDGMMLYYEDFSSYGDTENLQDTLDTLGWVIQTKEEHGVYSDWSTLTGVLSLVDGKLVVKNYNPEAGFVGTDGYFSMLDYDYMIDIADYGDYTLQYDVTYYDASDCGRYFCIVTDYAGNSYNSFHFRMGGYGNNQGHHYKNNGDWVTYDIVDPVIDLSAKLTDCDPEKGTTIAYKLLGIDSHIGGSSDTNKDMFLFKDITVTIRIQHDDDVGQTVYMKTADMPDFVCVTAPHETAGGADFWYDLTGMPGLAFKVGAAINGHLDNIAMWAGFGDMPEDTTVTYQPSV
jgi:hypothetical protein